MRQAASTQLVFEIKPVTEAPLEDGNCTFISSPIPSLCGQDASRVSTAPEQFQSISSHRPCVAVKLALHRFGWSRRPRESAPQRRQMQCSLLPMEGIGFWIDLTQVTTPYHCHDLPPWPEQLQFMKPELAGSRGHYAAFGGLLSKWEEGPEMTKVHACCMFGGPHTWREHAFRLSSLLVVIQGLVAAKST